MVQTYGILFLVILKNLDSKFMGSSKLSLKIRWKLHTSNKFFEYSLKEKKNL